MNRHHTRQRNDRPYNQIVVGTVLLLITIIGLLPLVDMNTGSHLGVGEIIGDRLYVWHVWWAGNRGWYLNGRGAELYWALGYLIGAPVGLTSCLLIARGIEGRRT